VQQNHGVPFARVAVVNLEFRHVGDAISDHGRVGCRHWETPCVATWADNPDAHPQDGRGQRTASACSSTLARNETGNSNLFRPLEHFRAAPHQSRRSISQIDVGSH